MRKKTIFLGFITACLLCYSWLPAQQGEAPTVTVEQVSGGVYCLYGQGGNIGLLKTGEGLVLVDSQFEKTAGDVLKQVAVLSPEPVKFLVNTHYHDDHTGGTGVIGKEATIIMHPHCLASLKKSQKEKGSEKAYLAKVKPWTKGMKIQLGGESIKLLHFGNGHTAGDLVVVFEKAKVLHTGDLFFHGMPPYIDVADGADTENWVHTIRYLCKNYPDYKIIPGHGKVTGTEEYIKMAGYLTYLRTEVAAAIKAGKTREQTRKSIDLGPYQWLKDTGPYTDKKNNIGWIYDEMTRQKD